jgi:cell division septation protein DedD
MSDENKDEFEHNDGLGDLLREREKLEFSWSKTIVVICSLFSIVTIGIYFIFNVGKNVIESEVKENILSKSTVVESKRSYVNSVKQNEKTVKSSSSLKNSSSKSISYTDSKTSNKSNVTKTNQNLSKNNASSSTNSNVANSKSNKTSKGYVAKSQSNKNQSKYSSTGNLKTTNNITSSRVKAKRNVSVYKYKVITGTFSNQKNAISHLNSLKTQGIKGFIKQTRTSLGNYFRVQVGAYKTQEKALQQQIKLKNINIDSYIYQE